MKKIILILMLLTTSVNAQWFEGTNYFTRDGDTVKLKDGYIMDYLVGVCISVVQSDGSFANLINTTGENVTWTKDSKGEYTHRGNVRLVSVTPFTADPTDITKWGININAENQVRFYNFDNDSVDAVFIALLIKTW